MDTEYPTQETPLQQIDPENTSSEVNSTLIGLIKDKYQQMLTICNDLSKESKPLPNQAAQLLNQATALYNEAQRLTPNYKPPKINTPQV